MSSPASRLQFRQIQLPLSLAILALFVALFASRCFLTDQKTLILYSAVVLGAAAVIQTGILIFGRGSREGMLLLTIVLFTLGVSLFAPRYILVDNLALILYSAAVLGIVAVAETVVILSGGIDISVGAILAISASLVNVSIQAGLPAPVGVGLGLAAGMVLGAVNGSLVAYLRIPPIIVTLATLNMFRGAIDLVMKGTAIPPPTRELSFLVSGHIGPIHMQVIIFLLVAVAAAVFLAHTRLGRRIYAVGDNPSAAEVSGVNLRRVRFFVYVASGLLSAIAGLVFAARSANVTRTAGLGMEFIAIGAVVLGGTNLFGGSGKIRGTVIGVIMIYAIYNAMVIGHIPATWQNAITGILIITAVSLNVARQRMGNDAG